MKGKVIDPKEVAKLAKYGLTQEQIADCFGLHGRALRNRLRNDATLDAAYKNGRAQGIGRVAQTVFQKAMAGNIACAFFYLKTQAGWRETERHEITGKEGEPIEIRDAQLVLRSRIDRLAARLGTTTGVAATRPGPNGRSPSPP